MLVLFLLHQNSSELCVFCICVGFDAGEAWLAAAGVRCVIKMLAAVL